MSRVRDLPELLSLDDTDILYVVDASEGPNGGKKVTVQTLTQKFAGDIVASDTAYQRTDGLKVDIDPASDDVESALSDLDDAKLSLFGTQSMAGDLNMGGNSITNVTSVDGVDVSDHSTRHQPGGSDPMPTASAVELTDSTNSEGVSTSLARADHTHAHGNRAGGTLHSAATPSVNGFMSSTDKSKLDKIPVGNISYSNSGAQTTSSLTFVNVTLNTDRESFTNSLFTKVNATDFQTDFTGQVEISYDLGSYPDTNDRATEIGLQRNSVDLAWTSMQTTAKADVNRQNAAGTSFTLNCTTGDIFRLRVRSVEGALITIPANKAYMTIRAARLA
jgi:hypothetical protein